MADTQELHRLALVPNLMDMSLSMPDENNFYIYFYALNNSQINFETS